MINPLIRFEAKFRRGSPRRCWRWRGSTKPNGYGSFFDGTRVDYSHRVAYRLYSGDIPVGLCVLHKCDNRLCVNPAHLFLGTKKDNATDKVGKGRQRPGEKHPMAKLSKVQVSNIRRLLRSHTQSAIAAIFSISQQQVSKIKNNQRWTRR